jgi:hypothetical protein
MKVLAVLALFFLGGVLTAALAQETAIARNDVPTAAPTASGREQGRGSVIGRITIDTENGCATYAVETQVGGLWRDLLFRAADALIESEEETSLAAIPPTARATFDAAKRPVKVERVAQDGTVNDQAEIEEADQHMGLAVDASGQRLTP